MASKLSRREMIRNVGVAGASGLLYAGVAGAGPTPRSGKPNGGQASEPEPFPQSSKELLRAHEAHQVELVCGDMVVAFDQRLRFHFLDHPQGAIPSAPTTSAMNKTRRAWTPPIRCSPATWSAPLGA